MRANELSPAFSRKTNEKLLQICGAARNAELAKAYTKALRIKLREGKDE